MSHNTAQLLLALVLAEAARDMQRASNLPGQAGEAVQAQAVARVLRGLADSGDLERALQRVPGWGSGLPWAAQELAEQMAVQAELDQ